MLKMSRKCYLHCAQMLHSPIELLHLQEIALGRSRETQIEDPDCSREQISFMSDCSQCIVWITSIGRNVSGMNGYALKNHNRIEAVHGDRIEFLLNKHVHIIKFDPPPAEKKKSSFDSNAISKKFKENNSPETKPTYFDRSVKTVNETFEKIDNGALFIYTSTNVSSSEKIAAYDVDGTIIKTKSGLVFPKTIDDWQFAFTEVPGKLKKLYSDGFKVVFFTNQASIGNGKLQPEDFKTKLQNIIRKLGIPVQAFISTGKGHYRKPLTGMWDTFVEMKNDNCKINRDVSFYCGDAAGRKGDHSLADRLFAKNINLPFFTPETHFCGKSESSYSKPLFDPKEYLELDIEEKNLISNNQEIIILVGYPGSGKSFVSKKMEQDSKYRYKIVCRDVLGTFNKCASEAEKAIKAGKSIIVDSTNPDLESRSRWIDFAKKYHLPCKCFKMDVSFEHAKHNNKFRQLTDTKHSIVGDMVFNSYKKKYVEPKLDEGFQEIIFVNFLPKFDNTEMKKLYEKYMLEK